MSDHNAFWTAQQPPIFGAFNSKEPTLPPRPGKSARRQSARRIPGGAFGEIDYQINRSICAAAAGKVLVGDFNGDGRDDLACHDTDTGLISIDLAGPKGELGVTDSTQLGWCNNPGTRSSVGAFTGKDNLLCHDMSGGQSLSAFINGSLQLVDATFGFCNQRGDQLR